MSERHEAPGISSTVEGPREAWDRRYASGELVWGTEANVFVREHLMGLAPRRVLDLGCGQGRNAIWLAGQGHMVTGLDLSPVAIERARALAAEAGVNVEFAAVDLAREWQPPSGEYDLIVMSYLQLPESTRRAVHARAIEALAPGGMIFLVAHHADNLEQGVGGPPYPEVLFAESHLAEDFAGLEIRRNERVYRSVEIEGQTGQALDLLFVATKPD